MKHSIIISNKIVGLIASIILSTFVISCGSEKDDFEMPSEEVLEKVAAATEVAGQMFSECNSISELEEHLDEIRNTEGVVDVWTDDITMYIKYEGFGTITYYYPILRTSPNNYSTRSSVGIVGSQDSSLDQEPKYLTRSEDNQLSKTHYKLNDSEKHSLVIYNALSTDEIFRVDHEAFTQLIDIFSDLGNSTNYLESSTDLNEHIHFFNEVIYNYDMVILNCHGDYDENTKKHWLTTGCLYKSSSNGLTERELEDVGKTAYNIVRKNNSDDYIRLSLIKEKVNGEYQDSYYWCLSEDYLSMIGGVFKERSIIYNSACKSLCGNKKLGDVFMNKGAVCYLGYNEINRISGYSAHDFFLNLLNGLSVHFSFEKLDGKYKHDPLAFNHLIVATKDNNEENKHVCIVHPDTVSYEEGSYSVLLKGSIKIADPNNDNEYGFALRNKDSKYVNPIKPGIKYNDGNTEKSKCTYNSKDHILTFECTVSKNEFKDVDQFCAYLYDGERYCLGDLKDIEIKEGSSCPDDNHPHAIDLGLPSGNKWSCCELGASEPLNIGGRYPWGYVTPIDPQKYKEDYGGIDGMDPMYSGYKYGPRVIYYKDTYHCQSDFEFLGDDISETQYDAVYKSDDWGNGWVMPNLKDFRELIDCCAFEYVTNDDKNYYKIIGPNGNYINLRYLNFWSSTLGPTNSVYPKNYMCAYALYGEINNNPIIDIYLRWEPFGIWPVYKKSSGK